MRWIFSGRFYKRIQSKRSTVRKYLVDAQLVWQFQQNLNTDLSKGSVSIQLYFPLQERN